MMTDHENLQEILKMVAELNTEQVLVVAEPGTRRYMFHAPDGYHSGIIQLDRVWAKRINETETIKYMVGTIIYQRPGDSPQQVVVISKMTPT